MATATISEARHSVRPTSTRPAFGGTPGGWVRVSSAMAIGEDTPRRHERMTRPAGSVAGMRRRLAALAVLVLASSGCGSGQPLPTVQHFADPAVLDVQSQARGYLGALNGLLLRRQTHLAYLTAVAQGDVAVHR